MDRYLEFILNHYILSLALAVVTFLLIQEFFDVIFKRFEAISPLLAVAKINDHNTIIIDVRESPDFIQGHIENAINAPLSNLSEQMPQLGKYKKNVILLTCQTGTRAPRRSQRPVAASASSLRWAAGENSPSVGRGESQPSCCTPVPCATRQHSSIAGRCTNSVRGVCGWEWAFKVGAAHMVCWGEP